LNLHLILAHAGDARHSHWPRSVQRALLWRDGLCAKRHAPRGRRNVPHGG
jgi:hypothetical protein